MNFYSHYHGKSVGRILGHMQELCGLHIAERVTVSDSKVYYPNEKTVFAEYSWVDGEGYSIPKFKFCGESGNPEKAYDWKLVSDSYKEYIQQDIIAELQDQIKKRNTLLDLVSHKIELLAKEGQSDALAFHFYTKCIASDIEKLQKESK